MALACSLNSAYAIVGNSMGFFDWLKSRLGSWCLQVLYLKLRNNQS